MSSGGAPSPLRPIAIALVVIETLVAVFYIAVFHQPGTNDTIANIAVESVTLIVSAIWVALVLPAIVLLVRSTHTNLALVFAIAAAAAFFANALIF